MGVGWRRRQLAWRQASEQKRRRPAGRKPRPQAGQAIVTASLRDGGGRFTRCPPFRAGPGELPAGPAAGFLEAERLAGGDDHDGVVEETVEQRGGGGLDRQEAAPVLEGPVAGDAEALALVGGGDEAEEQLGAGLVEGG